MTDNKSLVIMPIIKGGRIIKISSTQPQLPQSLLLSFISFIFMFLFFLGTTYVFSENNKELEKEHTGTILLNFFVMIRYVW